MDGDDVQTIGLKISIVLCIGMDVDPVEYGKFPWMFDLTKRSSSLSKGLTVGR